MPRVLTSSSKVLKFHCSGPSLRAKVWVISFLAWSEILWVLRHRAPCAGKKQPKGSVTTPDVHGLYTHRIGKKKKYWEFASIFLPYTQDISSSIAVVGCMDIWVICINAIVAVCESFSFFFFCRWEVCSPKRNLMRRWKSSFPCNTVSIR